MGPVIVEGPDGAGKSTFAARLASGAGRVVVKNGPPPPGTPLARAYLSQLSPGTVVDRSWPSEMIYGPILRGVSLVSREEAHELLVALADRGGRMVLCLPSFETCLATWRGRAGELFRDVAILKAVWREYVVLARDLVPRGVAILHDRTHAGENERVIALLSEGKGTQ